MIVGDFEMLLVGMGRLLTREEALNYIVL